MPTFLFDKIIFGPVQSRRMGVSLGVNLLPSTVKYCNFNCVYCECGLTPTPDKEIIKLLPSQREVAKALRNYLLQMEQKPDAITFAGNGEPTIHPEFVGVIEDAIDIRNELSPHSEIVVLTNATQMHKQHILDALQKIDRCMFKLDSAIEQSIQNINQPAQTPNVENFIQNVTKFRGKIIIQTLFISGEYSGKTFDNTTDIEVDALIEAYKKIKPFEVVVYGIQRDTPIETLSKISKKKLEDIAKKIELAGIKTIVSY